MRNTNVLVNNIVNWVSRNEKGNAIILFSKARIQQLVELSQKKLSTSSLDSISQRGSGSTVKTGRIKEFRKSLSITHPDLSRNEIENKIKEFEKKEFPDSQSTIIDKLKKLPGAMEIENSDLRTAISYGIGYIYTQDEVDVSADDKKLGKSGISENDKKIVANLFSSGKINVLIATPSIGIGVNVSIKNMYLPSVYRFESTGKDFEGRMVLNNKREMSQLLNRAGRGKTLISSVYTPKEFVNYLRDIVSMTPDDYNEVPAIAIYPTDDLQNILVKLHDSISSSKSQSVIKSYQALREFGILANRSCNILINKIREKQKKSSTSNFQVIDFKSKLNHEISVLRFDLKRKQQELENLIYYVNTAQIPGQQPNQILGKINELSDTIKEYEEKIQKLITATVEFEYKVKDYSPDIKLTNYSSEFTDETINCIALSNEIQIFKTDFTKFIVLRRIDDLKNNNSFTDKQSLVSYLNKNLDDFKNKLNEIEKANNKFRKDKDNIDKKISNKSFYQQLLKSFDDLILKITNLIKFINDKKMSF